MEVVKQDGNDSLDMLIRRAVGKDPFLTFHRPENSPVQLFQLLHSLERPGHSLSYVIGSDIVSVPSGFSRIWNQFVDIYSLIVMSVL